MEEVVEVAETITEARAATVEYIISNSGRGSGSLESSKSCGSSRRSGIRRKQQLGCGCNGGRSGDR